MRIYTISERLIVVLFFVLFSSLLFAQTPQFNWVKSYGSTSIDFGNAVNLDSYGNLYLTGEYTGTVNFGSSIIDTSKGFVDFFLLKYDANGNAVFSKTGGGSLTDRGYGVVVDKAGNIYATGPYGTVSQFDTVSITSTYNLNTFLVKYNSAGKLIWMKTGNAGSQSVARAIALDSSGNIYITGYFGSATSSTIQFDNLTLTSKGDRDIFVVKFDSSGNVKWGAEAGSTGSNEEGRDITADEAGNVYVTGVFNGTAQFGSATLTSAGGIDVFAAKYNTDGRLVWAKSAGGKKDDRSEVVASGGIALDKSGSLYICGTFDSVAVFGSDSITTHEVAGKHDTSDAFIAKMDTSGNFLWAKGFGGTSPDYCQKVKVDASGFCIGIGGYQGTADFGPSQLTSAGDLDVFYVKLDPLGNVVWAKSAGGSGKDIALSLALDNSTNIYSCGYFNGNAMFDTIKVISNGGADIFFCKLSAESVTPVELVTFTAAASNGKATLKWSTATETNNSGFDIERSSDNKAFNKIGFVQGKGTTTLKQTYSFTDNNAGTRNNYYRIKQIDLDGTYKYSSVVEVNSNVPVKYALNQNYPNPFNPSTIISFDLPVKANVSVIVYNGIGQQVKVLQNKNFEAGSHSISFDASKLASGVYFYGIKAAGSNGSAFTSYKKMILIR